MTDADTKPCPFCAETIKAAAIKCKHCGSVLSGGGAGLGTPATVGAVVCAVGGLAIAIGPLLPAVKLADITFSLTDKTDGEAYAILAMGVIAALASVLSFAVGRSLAAYALLVAVLGAVGALYYDIQVQDQLASLEREVQVLADKGASFAVIYAGAAIIVAGAIAGAVPRRREPPDLG